MITPMMTKPVRAPRCGALGLTTTAAAMLFTLGTMPAWALDEQSGEAKAISACEKQLCTMLLQRKPVGSDLKCQLSKTWRQSTIKEAESSTLKWGHGDTRCSADINLTRAAIVSAMTSEEFTYDVPKHTARCVIEKDGQVTNVTAKLAPKIIFKNGKAEKVWINLKDVDGPVSIKATIWTAARLADGVGLFHRKMIKSMNKFIENSCAKKYPQIASAAGLPAAKEKVRKIAKPAPEPSK